MILQLSIIQVDITGPDCGLAKPCQDCPPGICTNSGECKYDARGDLCVPKG